MPYLNLINLLFSFSFVRSGMSDSACDYEAKEGMAASLVADT
jgi:hypothetical protein